LVCATKGCSRAPFCGHEWRHTTGTPTSCVKQPRFIAGLAYNHAFVDGNQRSAAMAGFVFLRANGLRIAVPPLAFASAVIAATELGNINQATAQLETWLHAHIEDIGAR
jgi:prophage maintenance system killer protein